MYLEKIEFEPNRGLSMEENLMDYMHAFARQKKLESRYLQNVHGFFVQFGGLLSVDYSSIFKQDIPFFNDEFLGRVSLSYSLEKVPETHSANNGDKLTDWEKYYIRKTNKCPDCRVVQLAKGPQGGMSTNCKCFNCGSMFNLTLEHNLAFADRISDSGTKVLQN